MFSGLSFLKGPMKVEDTAAEIIVGAAAAIGMVFFIIAGRLSDRVGRKKPIVWGYALTLLLLFPCFWWMGSVANPALEAAAERSEEQPSELQSLMRISYAVFCLQKKKTKNNT